MKVRKLDHNHDWQFGRGLAHYVTNSAAIAQCVETKLLALKNDWFLNRDDGIAWFDYLVKNPNIDQLEGDIKTVILSVDGVVEIIEFDILLDSETRKFLIQVSYNDKFKQTSEVKVNVTSDR